jgi:hypothetical protein
MNTPGGVDRAANIGVRGCRRRRATGWMWLAAGLALAVGLRVGGAPNGVALAVAVPFALSAFGFLQARWRTCVVLALAGVRDRQAQESPGFDAGAARRRALLITALSMLIGVAAALLAIAILRF